MLATITDYHCKNDPYFYGKSLLNLHGRDMRQSCKGLFLSALTQMSERQISTLSVTFLQQKRIPLNHLPHAQTGWWFLCYKYVTDSVMSNIKYLFTDPSVFFM